MRLEHAVDERLMQRLAAASATIDERRKAELEALCEPPLAHPPPTDPPAKSPPYVGAAMLQAARAPRRSVGAAARGTSVRARALGRMGPSEREAVLQAASVSPGRRCQEQAALLAAVIAAAVEAFQGFPAEALLGLAQAGECVPVPAGTQLTAEAEPGESFSIVLRGAIEYVRAWPSRGQSATTAIQRVGDACGDLRLGRAGCAQRTPAMVALDGCVLLRISQEAFEHSLSHPQLKSLSDHVRFLAALPLCLSCSWQQLVRLGQALKVKRLQPKEVAVRQGDVCHQLYFVFSGRCRRFLAVGGGAGGRVIRQMQLARLGEGDVFGESAVLDEKPPLSRFSVEAEGEAVLLTLSSKSARRWQGGEISERCQGVDPDPMVPFAMLRELRLLSRLHPEPQAVCERFYQKHEWENKKKKYVERVLFEMCETKINASRRLPFGGVSPRLREMHTELSTPRAKGSVPRVAAAPTENGARATHVRTRSGHLKAGATCAMPVTRVECYSWDDRD